ncbi:auxin-responsive protein IAA33 [Salvia miltiorrhiza]|uniref:auxin-responsive protein IAA33 n=1 Tax=Salvia miltiorrhiza TaxID=226208 RepID=UPI0025AC92B1|nr:auxin-responsive protein IAA33 [Salvia miltiorrhiza]
MSSSFDPQRQESLKRMWQLERREVNPRRSFFDEELVAAVVPPVTVVLEGRSICQRISLHKHASYHSLARALRQMFAADSSHETNLDLTNAVPGHLIAYEDMENDLLLVGDLNWKDFVRVAKRIRILPVKPKSRNQNKAD